MVKGIKYDLSRQILQKKFPNFTDNNLLDEIYTQGKFYTSTVSEILIQPDTVITHFPLVLFGRIRLYREDGHGKEVFLYSIQSGESCAIALDGKRERCMAGIKAISDEDSEMIMIPVEFSEEWIIKYKEWREFVSTTYQNRFSDILHVIDLIAFGQLGERLEYFLKQSVTGNHSRKLRITHQEIAESLGSSREVITRLLSQMEKNGKVKTGRNQLELLPELFRENDQ